MNDMKGRLNGIFRSVTAWGTAKEIAGNVIAILGAFLVSGLLEAAMDAEWNRVGVTVVVAAVFIGVSYLVDSYLTGKLKRVHSDSMEEWRETVSELTVSGNIDITSAGAYDGRAEDDTETIANYRGMSFPQMVGSALTMAIAAIVILVSDWRLAIIFLTLSLLQLIPTVIYEKWTKRIYDETSEDEEAYADWIGEGLHGIRTIKSYEAESWYTERYRKCNKEMISSGIKAEGTGTFETVIGNLIESILSWGAYIIIGAFTIFWDLDILLIPLMVVMSQRLFAAASVFVEAKTESFEAEEAEARLGTWIESRKPSDIPVLARLEHVTKTFDDKRVLDDVSLSVKAGERIRLIGENGSGKTTMLKILMGFMTPDDGSAEIRDVKVAYAFQEETMLPCTGEELIAEAVSTGESDEAELRKHIDRFGIGNVLTQSLDEMSGGESKKLFLALALAKKSDLLVLDEPTNHMDRESIPYLIEVLKAYEGTLIVCTHDERMDIDWTRTMEVKEGRING